ncbi:prophage protein [Lactococcus lactis subsp. lactis]|uniref:Prophage protein n=2 Tax=Lactococcus TaxID=1357 RepID=A0A1V0NHQ9_LACLL|nr:prophage protein [Lactococcus lactis subsp. lactis]
MRYLGIANLRDIERMTISEYELRLKAYRLKRLDEQEFIYQQAWANWQVQSTKQQGKKQVPVYSTFKKFFDKEKFENDILGIETSDSTFKKDKKLINLMKKANK